MSKRSTGFTGRSQHAAHRLSPAQGCDRFTLHRKSPLVAAGPGVTASEPSTTGESPPRARVETVRNRPKSMVQHEENRSRLAP